MSLSLKPGFIYISSLFRHNLEAINFSMGFDATKHWNIGIPAFSPIKKLTASDLDEMETIYK